MAQFMVMVPVLVEADTVSDALDIVTGRVEGVDGVLEFDKHNVYQVEDEK